MMSTNDIGSRSEAMILAAMLRAGYSVLVPYNVLRYDLAFDEDGQLRRVQVKTGRLLNGSVRFNMYSLHGRKNTRTYYSREEIDYFGVYCHELDKSYLVPMDDLATAEGSLRVEPTKNNQSHNVRWAENYEIVSLV